MLFLVEDSVNRWVLQIELDNEGYACPKLVSYVNLGYQEATSVSVKSPV